MSATAYVHLIPPSTGTGNRDTSRRENTRLNNKEDPTGADCPCVLGLPEYICNPTNLSDFLKGVGGNVDPVLVFFFMQVCLRKTERMNNCNLAQQIAITAKWQQEPECFIRDYISAEIDCLTGNNPYSMVCGTDVILGSNSNCRLDKIVQENLLSFIICQLWIILCNAETKYDPQRQRDILALVMSHATLAS
jgi:hypothetical protein